MNAPYSSTAPVPTPAVWTWYVVYIVAMAVMYVLVAVFGLVLVVINPATLEMEPMEANIQGIVCLLMGAFLFVPYAVAPFLPKQPWAWIYGMVLICIGMTSCCCLPACIPLLLSWIKPECKLFFGRPA